MNALRIWVTEQSRNKNVNQGVQKLINSQHPLKHELIVYRGHKNSPNTINPRNWFSTSSSIKIARDEYAGKECCLFKIHVQPGISVLHVNNLLNNIEMYKDENEIIVNGGGEFFKDSKKSEVGFTYKNGMYHTYYFPKIKKTTLNNKQLFNRILKDEYEYINTINNLRYLLRNNENANNSNLQKVLNRVIKTRHAN